MFYNIEFMNIVRIELSDIRQFGASENSEAFYTRNIVLRDKDGRAYPITVYADSVEALRPHADDSVREIVR
jgi:hypothetical protein